MDLHKIAEMSDQIIRLKGALENAFLANSKLKSDKIELEKRVISLKEKIKHIKDGRMETIVK